MARRDCKLDGSSLSSVLDRKKLKQVKKQVAAELKQTRRVLNAAYSSDCKVYEETLAANHIARDSYKNTEFDGGTTSQQLRGKLPETLFQETHEPHNCVHPPPLAGAHSLTSTSTLTPKPPTDPATTMC